MPKQTTLFQTWGYEGNIPSQDSTHERANQVRQSSQDRQVNQAGQNRQANQAGHDRQANQASQNRQANLIGQDRTVHQTGTSAVDEECFGTDDDIDGFDDDGFGDDDAEFNQALQQSNYEDVEKSANIENPGSFTRRPGTATNCVSATQNNRPSPSNFAKAQYSGHIQSPNLSSVGQTPGRSQHFSSTAGGSSQVFEVIPGFDLTAGSTWIYPTNKSYRQYQFDIVKSCLYDNTLVCLPTGLGKTFIAAVVMYNFYRWYPQGKIVFMAPTKPLVAQQIEACFYTMGIPQTDCMEMTGSVSVSIRQKAWVSKRVFFLTPQVMSNDLARGLFPAKDVKLLVVDEAHKAQGEYAYCQVARELFRSQSQTRIVALSATPGNDIQAVKSVLQNLFISHIELRHEESPDVLPYTNQRQVDKIVVGLGKELQEMKDCLLSVMEIYTKRLSTNKAVRQGHNPSAYSKFSILKSRDEWRQNPPGGVTPAVRGIVEADFAVCMSLYHGYELLTQHGMRPFFNFFTKKDEGDMSGRRINQSLGRIPAWRDILEKLTEKFKHDAENPLLNQSRIHMTQQEDGSMVKKDENRTKIEVSHPKIQKLIEVILQHFKTFADKGLDTRVMIFSQYRDSVHEVVGCLSDHSPTIKPMAFIGQAGSIGKKGLTQKEQIEVISRFRSGGYNTLVATCVGEEGLDIGEVDLIVLFDVSKSPIRLVQRMGRTGRKRAGRIVVLVTEGVEERKYNQSLISKKNINAALLDRNKLVHALYQDCPRMIPRGLDPTCLQMTMITGEFKAPSTSRRSGANDGKFVSRKSGNKYDIFRHNRGFLTDTDQERWEDICGVEATKPVKRIMEPQEYWNKDFNALVKSPQDIIQPESRIDLSDYALWNEEAPERKYVSEGSLSRVYLNIRKLCADPDQLSAQAEKMTDNITKEREKSIGAGLTAIRATNQRKPEKVKIKRTISTFFNPQSQQEQTAGNNGQGAQLITLDDEEDDEIDIDAILNSPTGLPTSPSRPAKPKTGFQNELKKGLKKDLKNRSTSEIQAKARREIQIESDIEELVDAPIHIDIPFKDVSDNVVNVDLDLDGVEVDEYKELLCDLFDDSDEDSGIGFCEIEKPLSFDVKNVLENQHTFKITQDTKDKWFASKEKYQNMFFLSTLKHKDFIQMNAPEIYPVLLNHSRATKNQSLDHAKSPSNIRNDAKRVVDRENEKENIDQNNDDDLFEISSPMIEESQEIETVHKTGEDLNAAGGKVFDVAGDFEDVMGGDFDIGSSPLVVQDDGNISPLPSIQQSQDIFASTSVIGQDYLMTKSPIRRGLSSARAVFSPSRTGQHPPTDLDSSPIISRSQKHLKKQMSKFVNEESGKMELESSTPLTTKGKGRRSSLLTSSNLTPIKETNAPNEDINSPILRRPKVLAIKKDRKEDMKQSSRKRVLNSSYKFNDILSEYTPPRLTDRFKDHVEEVVPQAQESPDLFGDDSFDEEDLPDPIDLHYRASKYNKPSRKDLFKHASAKDDTTLDKHVNADKHKLKNNGVKDNFENNGIDNFSGFDESLELASKDLVPKISRPAVQGGSSSSETLLGASALVSILYHSPTQASSPRTADPNKRTAKKSFGSNLVELESVEPNFDVSEPNKDSDEELLELMKDSNGVLETRNDDKGICETGNDILETRNDILDARNDILETRNDILDARNDISDSAPLVNFDFDMSEDMFAVDEDEDFPIDDVPLKQDKEIENCNNKENIETSVPQDVQEVHNPVEGVQSKCPICGDSIPGAEGGPEVNAHIDACLSKDIINEFYSQQPPLGGNSSAQISPTKDTQHNRDAKKRNTLNTRDVKKRKLGDDSELLTPHDDKKRKLDETEKKEAKVSTSEEEGDSPILRWRGSRARVLATQVPDQTIDNRSKSSSHEDSPSEDISTLGNKRRHPYQIDSSDEDSFVKPGQVKPRVFSKIKKKQPDLESDDESFIQPARINPKQKISGGEKKKKQKAGRGFLDYEAELSGSDIGSDANSDGSVDKDVYEESFVDDCSQQVDTAMYLRSVRSPPQFKQPVSKKLPPITADIFSQVPEPDDSSYLQDSFVVDSDEVEFQSEPDTLDILEARVNNKRAGGKKPSQKQEKGKKPRRRIVMADDEKDSSSDECTNREDILASTQIENHATDISTRNNLTKTPASSRDNSNLFTPASSKLGTGAFSTPGTGPTRTPGAFSTPGAGSSNRSGVSKRTSRRDDDFICVRPDLSNSATRLQGYPNIIIASTEINKIPTIISNLKHIHKINVLMRQTTIPFTISTRMCALRIFESDFNMGTYRKQLEEKIAVFRDLFDKIAFIVEKDKDRVGGGKPATKIHLKTLAQLAATKIQILYSVNKEHTGLLLADLVAREDSKGLGIPRGRLSLGGEDMVKFCLNIPGVGLGLAMKLTTSFTRIKSLILAKPEVLVEKTGMSKHRAEKINSFFNKQFHDSEILPL